MSAAGTAWSAAARAGQLIGRAGQLIGRHKVMSASVVVFVAAVIGVSLATSGSATPRTYKAAPGFTLAALGSAGPKVSLSEYAGKPVILNFWASWCDPCQKETPLLASWYKQHPHVVLLGLDENDTMAKAVKFAAAKGVTYPLAFDPNATVPGGYGVDALPQTFFLNAKHQIVYQVIGAVTGAKLDKGLSLMDSTS
jgi:cytochrome c biogenesis protein CcmG/thiol:disulfide interchange protein DsbE